MNMVPMSGYCERHPAPTIHNCLNHLPRLLILVIVYNSLADDIIYRIIQRVANTCMTTIITRYQGHNLAFFYPRARTYMKHTRHCKINIARSRLQASLGSTNASGFWALFAASRESCPTTGNSTSCVLYVVSIYSYRYLPDRASST